MAVIQEPPVAPTSALSAMRPQPALHDADQAGGPSVGAPGHARNAAAIESAKADLGEAMRRWIEANGSHLTFERDDATGQIVARLRNPATGELIRQVPPEEMLRLARAIDRYLGLLVDRHG